MSIVLQSSSGGSVTIAEPATASNFTQTLPAASGEVMVSGNQPAFSAGLFPSNQTVSTATWTKITINTEDFDTSNAFDSTTNYRFTPQVAGYYQVNGEINSNAASGGYLGCAVYKNGSNWKTGINMPLSSTQAVSTSISTLVYLNGSTDYIELYCYQNSGSNLLIFTSGTAVTWFQSVLVRAA